MTTEQIPRKLTLSALPLIAWSTAWGGMVYFDVVIDKQSGNPPANGVLDIVLPSPFLIVLIIVARAQFKPRSWLAHVLICVVCLFAFAAWSLLTLPLMMWWHVSLGGTL